MNILKCLILLFALSSCSTPAKSSELKTRIILTRHAEKQKGKDPSLTEAGLKRAKALSQLAECFEISGIYSSDFKRTKQTVGPLAKKLELEINSSISPVNYQEMKESILENHKGNTVVVAGHSNTVPDFINFLLDGNVLDQIDESDFSNLFVV